MNRPILTTLAALMALPAAAQTAGNGLTFGGEVKLEYLDANPRVWAFDGDVGMSWRSGGLLGFDAALDTSYLDDGSDVTNVWAALVLSTGAGEFAVGAPRPLLETQRVMPRFSSSRLIDLELGFLRGPITPLESAEDKGVTPGLTYLNTAGSLTYGAGYHYLNDGDGLGIFEGVMQYKAGPTTLFITGELADVDGPNATLLQIGAFHDADRYDVGAAFAHFVQSDGNDSLRLYGSFDVVPSLTVRGDVVLVQDSRDIYSLSASYGLSNGLFVEGGGTKIQNGPETYDIGVGFKF
ncbi:hypothetical protein [Tabrizicola thermarum]|uniref:hypothetical protein n=1 Tax=Tabrizicola thermarum TaxID=2670345 RepID=UPI000FFBD6BE|nr:hypothetical protein [Tabrizicola thermarum]